MEEIQNELIDLGNQVLDIFGDDVVKATGVFKELNNILKDPSVRRKLPEMIQLVQQHKDDPQGLMGAIMGELMF